MLLIGIGIKCLGRISIMVMTAIVLRQFLGLQPVEGVSLLVEEVQASYRNRDSFQLCGTRLASAIRAFCDNHARLQGLYAGYQQRGQQGPRIIQPEQTRHSWLPPRQHLLGAAQQLAASNRIKRAGVSDECCRKACNESQLLKYCAGVQESHESDDEIPAAVSSESVEYEEQKQDEYSSDEDDDGPAFDVNDVPFLPLLLDLIYSSAGENALRRPQATFRPFIQHERAAGNPRSRHHHPIIVPNAAPRIIARDTSQNRRSRPHSVHRNRHSLVSDETRRDLLDNSYEERPVHVRVQEVRQIPATTNQPPPSVVILPQSETLESHAVQVEDDFPDTFPIFGGTNNDWVGL